MMRYVGNLYVFWTPLPVYSVVSLRVASMRLAYQELQIDRKKEEKKLQNLEGKKREQAERLGMGLVSRRYLLYMKKKENVPSG